MVSLERVTFLLPAVVLGMVILAGCVQQGPSCPQCPNPSVWSECNASSATKTRTVPDCGPETDYECRSATETAACKTELLLSGANGLAATVSPTLDETVGGILKVTIGSLPSEGDKVWVMLSPQGGITGDDPFQDPNTIIQVVDAEAGKTVYLDTTNVENGVYNLGLMTSSNPSGAPWTDGVQTQLLVAN